MNLPKTKKNMTISITDAFCVLCHFIYLFYCEAHCDILHSALQMQKKKCFLQGQRLSPLLCFAHGLSTVRYTGPLFQAAMVFFCGENFAPSQGQMGTLFSYNQLI